jgi:FtsH-binding integral membrane protein
MFGKSAPERNIVGAVATLGVSDRVDFIRKTYAHLFAAICVFAGLCWTFLVPLHDTVAVPLTQWVANGRWNWLAFLGLFMVAGFIGEKFSMSQTSRGMQYLGLSLYTLAEAVIFVPLLFIAQHFGGPSVIPTAAVTTLLVFAGLTGTVFITKKDFSFLRGALVAVSMGALAIILVSTIFNLGMTSGLLFSGAMVVLASGYILYYTSRIMAHYHPQQYVAASLALFSAVALLFWYMIRIVMSLRE